MSRTYGKAQDLIDFTRASSGTALRRVKYGAELVANGTFDSADGWAVPSGWAIGSGVATGSAVSASLRFDAVNPTAGKIYFVEFDCTRTSGTIYMTVGGNFSGQYSSSQSKRHSVAIIAGSTAGRGVEFYGGTFTGTIDNVSVKEVTFDTSDGDLILFNHPNNIPRIEYDTNGSLLGLLVEESRTNLITYSEDITATGWGLSRGVGSTSTILYRDNTVSDYGPAASFTATVSVGVSYTVRFLVEKRNASWFVMNIGSGADYSRQWFNIDAGTLGSTATAGAGVSASNASIEQDQDGKFWISLTVIPTGTSLSVGGYACGADSSYNFTTQGPAVYLSKAQLEAGSFPTSYIPTSGSTATRSADVASLSTNAFGYRQDAFTVFIEASHFYDTFPTFNRFWELSGGGDSLGLYGNAGGSSYVSMTVGGVSQISFSDGAEAAADANTFMKYGIGLKTNDFDIARDGSLDTGDTSVTMPDAIDTFNIGKAGNNSAILNGHIKSIKYYPRRLLNSQLVELTS